MLCAYLCVHVPVLHMFNVDLMPYATLCNTNFGMCVGVCVLDTAYTYIVVYTHFLCVRYIRCLANIGFLVILQILYLYMRYLLCISFITYATLLQLTHKLPHAHIHTSHIISSGSMVFLRGVFGMT